MSGRKTNFSLTAVLISLLLAASVVLAQETKEYEDTFEFDQYGTVSIDTYKGSINVETWDKNEIYFYAKVEPDLGGWSDISPEEQLERCEVRLNKSNDYVSLESDYQNDIWGNSGTLALVHYEIKMPASARLRIDDYKSETHVENLDSDFEIETYKGTVNIVNFSGELTVDTYKGTVEIDYSNFTDDAYFDTYKGEIELHLPSNSKFDFDFDLGRKGDFESDFDMVMKSYSSDEGARGKVNGGGPEIKFSTYKGEIVLREKS